MITKFKLILPEQLLLASLGFGRPVVHQMALFAVEMKICSLKVKKVDHIPIMQTIIERRYEISNNVVCATSKASDQPAHMGSMIRAFASRLSII